MEQSEELPSGGSVVDEYNCGQQSDDDNRCGPNEVLVHRIPLRFARRNPRRIVCVGRRIVAQLQIVPVAARVFRELTAALVHAPVGNKTLPRRTAVEQQANGLS